MHHAIGEHLLLLPEERDLEQLYLQKNDPEVSDLLGGFGFGYAMDDLRAWLAYHRGRKDELLLAIRERESGKCIGHVGLYNIDFRIRSCEFGIMIGDRASWGRGLGRRFTRFAIDYAFRELNMNRVALSLLATNKRAEALYKSLQFRSEGVLRQAQYKNGAYVDVILMAILRSDYHDSPH